MTRRSGRRAATGLGIVGIDHIQLAMPRGEEALARLFYAGLLGLTEVAKPRVLGRHGGCWFVGPAVAIHLGVERPFRPAVKAHPGLIVGDLAKARAKLAEAGMPIEEDDSGISVRRCYVRDPFGNRIELIAAEDRDFSRRRRRRSGPARTEP